MKHFLFTLACLLAFACNTPVKEIWIDEMDLSTSEQGWGEAQPKKAVEGRSPITIAGKVYEHGFGTHAAGLFVINLKGNALRFKATVGVDDEADHYAATGGSCVFRLVLDNKEIYCSDTLRPIDSCCHIDVDVEGGKELQLIVDNAGDGSHGDHADWADARLVVKANAAEMPSPMFAVKAVEPYILTPKAGPQPIINGPDIFGARPGHPFLYRIPASGERPMIFAAGGLPAGLKLDTKTGIISGSVAAKGKYSCQFFVSNKVGSDTLDFDIVIGDTLCLTPPMG